jgi:hypothetical protein
MVSRGGREFMMVMVRVLVFDQMLLLQLQVMMVVMVVS